MTAEGDGRSTCIRSIARVPMCRKRKVPKASPVITAKKIPTLKVIAASMSAYSSVRITNVNAACPTCLGTSCVGKAKMFCSATTSVLPCTICTGTGVRVSLGPSNDIQIICRTPRHHTPPAVARSTRSKSHFVHTPYEKQHAGQVCS
jgi:hypothetical protein